MSKRVFYVWDIDGKPNDARRIEASHADVAALDAFDQDFESGYEYGREYEYFVREEGSDVVKVFECSKDIKVSAYPSEDRLLSSWNEGVE